jgi:ubiquinone/menaquinone biosynthesis C-methylase UbiE
MLANNGTKVMDAETQKALDVEYHRQAAATYDATVTRYFHFFHVHSLYPWAKRLVARKPGATALDVGTGTGVVACTLASFGFRARGIDHSPDMLGHAAERARTMGVSDSVQFDLADGEKLPYPDATFDAVTIQGVIHHLPDAMPMLRESYRVLKPDGELYISEPCREGTPISRLLTASLSPVRLIKRLLGAKPAVEPSVSDHEEPVAGAALVKQVQSLGMETQVEYLIRTGLVKAFPEPLKIWATLLFSLPTRRSRGDIMFLIARKK